MKSNNIKISLYDNRNIVIVNYNRIISLEEEVIIVDKYVIKGYDLKVKSIDGEMIKIAGIIKGIDVNEISY